jgi:hypothetical protein
MTAMMAMRDKEDFDLIAMASPRATCAVASTISICFPLEQMPLKPNRTLLTPD